MMERGVGGSGGIGMFTWDVLDGGEGDLVGCCYEFVGGVGGGNYNYVVGFYDGAGNGPDKFGAKGDVFYLVEERNVGHLEGYIRGE